MDPLFYLVVILYLVVTFYLGYLGWRHTRSAADYMVAGGRVNGFLVSLSYGATFISTSAIVGFGGAAAAYGMSMLWLAALNIFVGIFIAFAFLGKRIRTMGANLGAHTFPELMSRRFNSRFIHGYAALIIALVMPLYAAAVMIGGARFLEQVLKVEYTWALVVFAILVAVYVFFGGLRGVIYTDALQGAIMFAGMVILLVLTYVRLGGVIPAHTALSDLKDLVPAALAAKGHAGWTAMPLPGSELWWYVVSTLVLGVGIGVLAQPQLAVRFMALRSGREFGRGLVVGGIFILAMTGTVYVVGALSNVFFHRTAGKIALAMVTDPVTGTPNIDRIIPLYISQALPHWFVYIFMLTLLAAAMSTLSSQFHAIGTSVRDLYYLVLPGAPREQGMVAARAGVLLALAATLYLGFRLPVSIIALATSIFFGLCAASFLPALVAALYWPRATRGGVIAGIVSGSLAYGFMVFFVHQKEAVIFGVAQALLGKPYIASFPWNIIDPLVVALPASVVGLIAVSLVSRALPQEHLRECFRGIGGVGIPVRDG
ncbi:MAG: sodium:solute symporter family protein [Bacillota bacterium]